MQNDLSQLRKRLGRAEQCGTVDVRALDEAIRRTEDSVKVTHTHNVLLAISGEITIYIIDDI